MLCDGCYDVSPFAVLVAGRCEQCRGVERPAPECAVRSAIRQLPVPSADDVRAYHLLGRHEADRTPEERVWLAEYTQAPPPAVVATYTRGEHVGVEGGRCDIEVHVTQIRELEPGDFGRRFLVTMRTPTDALVVWFTGEGLPFDEDARYLIRATVKSHETYLGERQTVVQRCKILETREVEEVTNRE